MIETNPFRNFIPAQPRMLILGSFPCLKNGAYGDWFYSGSGKNHFWGLLSDLFGAPATNREEKIRLCEKKGIALSDIAYRITRTRENCSDTSLKILEFNSAGLDACLASGITKIYFTSRFVERHFKKLYPQCRLPSFLLLSPSPAANMHIGSLADYRQLRSSGAITSPYEYRLLKYRKILK